MTHKKAKEYNIQNWKYSQLMNTLTFLNKGIIGLGNDSNRIITLCDKHINAKEIIYSHELSKFIVNEAKFINKGTTKNEIRNK